MPSSRMFWARVYQSLWLRYEKLIKWLNTAYIGLMCIVIQVNNISGLYSLSIRKHNKIVPNCETNFEYLAMEKFCHLIFK
jgi:hypothetical protein